MSHVLLTFLGKGEKGSDNFYEREKYHFNDNDTYFGIKKAPKL